MTINCHPSQPKDKVKNDEDNYVGGVYVGKTGGANGGKDETFKTRDDSSVDGSSTAGSEASYRLVIGEYTATTSYYFLLLPITSYYS